MNSFGKPPVTLLLDISTYSREGNKKIFDGNVPIKLLLCTLTKMTS